MFVRNVGHLTTTPMIRLPDGGEAPEGLCDTVLTSLCALHDLKELGSLRNSRAGSIYIVKPKQHGPEECAFTDRVMDAAEDMLGLARHKIKVDRKSVVQGKSVKVSVSLYGRSIIKKTNKKGKQ